MTFKRRYLRYLCFLLSTLLNILNKRDVIEIDKYKIIVYNLILSQEMVTIKGKFYIDFHYLILVVTVLKQNYLKEFKEL